MKDNFLLELVLKHLLKCEGLSCLKLHLEKTEIITVGKSLGKSDMPTALQNVQLKSVPFKTLGIWFTEDSKKAATLNYKNTISRAKRNLKIRVLEIYPLKEKFLLLNP